MAPFISLLPTRRARPASAAAPASDLDALFLNSPGPRQSSSAVGEGPVDGDMSLLDFNLLLQAGGGSPSTMLNEESFHGVDDTLATIGGACLMDELIEEEEEEHPSEPSVQQQEEEEQKQRDLVIPALEPALSKPAAARSRHSLAPLPPVALPLPPSPPPVRPPVAVAPAIALAIALAPIKPAGSERPRASLARPAHILPKDHPSHPRQSVAFLPPPPAVANGLQKNHQPAPTAVLSQPKRSALKQSSSASSASQNTTAEVFAIAPRAVASPQAMYPPTITVLAGSSSPPQDPFDSPGLPFDGDSSLPTIGVPLDLRGSTSTPARLGVGSLELDTLDERAEEELQVVGEEHAEATAEPFSKPRRTTMAVKFALPNMEDSRETTAQHRESEVEQQKEGEPSQQVAKPAPAPKVSTAALKRRASRAFEAAVAAESFDLPQPSLTSSTSRRASRTFASAAPVISVTPGLSVPSSSTRRLSSLTPQHLTAEEQPRTVIRLSASASSHRSRPRASVAGRAVPPPAPAATAPASGVVASSAPQATTAPPKTKVGPSTSGGLTLPCDFDLLNRGAEREAERKRKAEQREKEREMREREEAELKKKSKTSAWGAPAAKGNQIKRAKLAESLPADRPSPAHPSSALYSSAPAPRQPRSRPSHAQSSSRRRSVAPSSDPSADLSSSSALTKEALEASQHVEGPKHDLKRRVSTYLEGVLPGVAEEEEDSYEAEERLVQGVTAPEENALKTAPSSSVNRREAESAAASAAHGQLERPLRPSVGQNQVKQVASVAANRPTTKVQPFTFGSTSQRSRQAPAAPTGTASPIFTESMTMWKTREAAAAALGAPPKLASSFGGGKRLASRAPLSRKPSASGPSQLTADVKRRRVDASGKENSATDGPKDTMWARTEQRRLEREAWEKKQREREEEVRKVKERQRKEQAEQERSKLKALRDALVIQPHPIPASTYRTARRA